MSRATKRLGIAVLSLVLAVSLATGTFLNVSAKQYLPTEDAAYAPQFGTLNEAKRAGNKLNERIAEEGMILLKNEATDGRAALPLGASERRVSVFGSRSDCEIKGGSGSGSGVAYEGVTFLQAMEDAGFQLNPKLKELYAATGENEPGIGSYTPEIVSSYPAYSDLAIIVFSRTGHEGSDMTVNKDGTHELQPTANELALLNHVCEQAKNGVFKKVLFLLNVRNVVEIGDYVDNPEIDAILYAGMAGSVGMKAVPRILTGEVNPSGRTVDVWPADFTKDPTWYNVLTNTHSGGSTVNIGTGPDGTSLPASVRSLDYEEGIYVGYKWYETASTIEGYFDAEEANQSKLASQASDPYYNRANGVLFPFGYGLSYTTFSWTVGEPSFSGEITAEQAGDRVTVPVTVKNTGRFAGKDVVEAYVRAPYDAETAPVEKSDVSMIAFEKTKLLQPGEEQTLNIEFDISDLASFDWNDANGNGFQGYELEPGNYQVLLRSDSHTDKAEGCLVEYSVSGAGIQYNKDGIDDPLNYNKGFGEETAKAVFSQNDEFNTARVGREIDLMGEKTFITEEDAKYVSRSNWYQPQSPTTGELTYSDAAVKVLFDQVYYGACKDQPTDPWYKTAEDIPGYGQTGEVEGGWKQAPKGSDPNRVCEIQLSDMTGVPIDDPLWVEFMNQLTWSEMTNLLTQCNYLTPAINCIGKPLTFDVDGPAQLRNKHNGGQSGTFWCSATIVASTYNKELCYEQGLHIGMEGMLIENNGVFVNGWYGPGLNTHRSPFGGRNFEYYSQDGVQGGLIAAAVIKGTTEMGMHVYAKHYVVNDQDTSRNQNGGISVWCNEQALREVYLRQFEYAVEYGNLNGMMKSHGKLGLYATQNNFQLNITVPCNEWGYEGVSVTDLVQGAPVASGRTQMTNADLLIRSGATFLGQLANQKRGEEPWFDGRILDGYYDAATNKVMVPSSLTVTDWVCNGKENTTPENGNIQTTSYTAKVAAGPFTLDSPTQWYWVRTTAMYSLYVAANCNQMQSVEDSDLVGAYVSIRYNDGVTPDEGYNVVKGTIISEPEKTPVVPEGKRFAGWYTDETYTEKVDFSKPVEGYTQICAYITDADQFAAIFNLNYPGAPDAGSFLIKRDTAAVPPPYEPSRAGFRFGGWYLEEECDTAADFANILMDRDRTFYAKWIPETTFTVTFDMNYDGVFDVFRATTDENGYLAEPVFIPVRDGYVFEGWYRDTYCKAEMDFGRQITADMTLYAKWTPAETEKDETGGGCASSVAFSAAGIAAAALLAAAATALKKRRTGKD